MSSPQRYPSAPSVIAALTGAIVIPSLLSVGKLSISGHFLLLHTKSSFGRWLSVVVQPFAAGAPRLLWLLLTSGFR